MSEATMRGLDEKYGDIPRFLTTAFVARDVDMIREALREENLTGFLVSYGTGIGAVLFEPRFPPPNCWEQDRVCGHLVF